ncbi:MAG: hypothetical protein M2R45_03760 [Verrucomicrobia subdivision 3 bacterium]|nr:hypothetical protein [Limisphaerales bacterium]MCS1416916.1 hypothetical protein [Limisphaerales bacterium]
MKFFVVVGISVLASAVLLGEEDENSSFFKRLWNQRTAEEEDLARPVNASIEASDDHLAHL